MARLASRRRVSSGVIIYGALTFYAALAIFPLYWLVTSSFKTGLELVSPTPTLVPLHPSLLNYLQVLSTGLIVDYFVNSIKIAVITTVCLVTIASLAAYSLTRFQYPGRSIIANSVLAAYMFPGILLAVPLTILYARIGLINTHFGLILAYVTFGLPFALWLLIAYFETIPREIDEAARVDGASHFGVYWRIILPLSMPGLVTGGIFAFLGAWNEFLLALVLIQQNELKTLPVGLALFLQGGPGDTIQWGGRMAAGVMVIIPCLVFFVLVSRYIVRGLAAGAVKG